MAYIHLTIRFPTKLHKRLTRIAQQEKRSLNNQVIFMLELSIAELERKIADREKEARGNGR